jgi:putative ABC transport system permease protein
VAWEVVGVVADEQVTSLDNKRDNPGIYVTTEQSPVYFGGIVVRGAIDPTRLERGMQEAVHSVDKDQPLTDVKMLEQIKTESMVGEQLRSLLLGVFAAIALLLSSIGIYGVISYSVAQRTGEIGIRAALGASRRDLVVLILSNGFWMTGAGLVLGFAGALGLTRLLATLLFGIGAYDLVTLAAVAALLGFVGLLASYIPARRAAGVDPAVTLRNE